METPLTVIEAYLPGASDRDRHYYLRLVEQVRASIRPFGLEVSLLVLPSDDTILWLVSVASPSSLSGLGGGDIDVPSAVAAATASEVDHVIERQLAGRLVDTGP